MWVPEAEGHYELKAEAVNVVSGSDVIIAAETRHVIVGQNMAPTIVITGGPVNSPTSQFAEFTTTVQDADGDVVRRVEFFDNGTLIGVDYEAPFGNNVTDYETNSRARLFKGTHNITARAYDSKNAAGVTVNPYVVQITGGNTRPELTVTSPAASLVVAQGNSITISCNVSDAEGNGTLTNLRAFDAGFPLNSVSDSTAPFGPLTLSTGGWSVGTHVVLVVAKDVTEESYPRRIVVQVQAGAVSTFAQDLMANIADESTANPSSPVFQGANRSAKEFSGGMAAGLQMDEGLVMTSGSAWLWNNGNSRENTYEGNDPGFVDTKGSGDPELEARVPGGLTRDAAIIEADIYCSHGQLEFEYQFGSEEYDRYVGDFNDGFLATVDGVVVTLVPDASRIVSVNSVNRGYLNIPASNPHLFLDNETEIKPLLTPQQALTRVEYNGMTIRLKAHAFVSPGTTHRLRIVIADYLDWIRDSALFVKKNSLRTISPQP